MSSDVRDILEMEAPSGELTKESVLNSNRRRNLYEKVKNIKRPEGMHREVYALLYNDNKDAPPLLPTDTAAGYIQIKARLGMKKVRKWEWSPFTNPGRTDSAVFHHWRRASDETKDYQFAQFNKPLPIPTYTAAEYSQHLKSHAIAKWSKAQTDHLFDLARRFDLRFIIMADRWDRATYGIKTVEDLKERYYEVLAALQRVQNAQAAAAAAAAAAAVTQTPSAATPPPPPPPPLAPIKPFIYDAEHERKRKEQLRKLFDRTPKQVEEEQMLLNELKKIEARKRERDRKTQDLQKLITQADQQGEAAPNAHQTSAGGSGGGSGGVGSASSASQRKAENKKHNKKAHKAQSQSARPSRVDSVVHAVESAGIKFNELRGTGVSLRSSKMKLPANLGLKKSKALELMMAEYRVDPSPPATEELSITFNELRSDMMLLCELRTALTTCSFELESLKHQYEAVCPGKTLSIPASLVMALPADEAAVVAAAAAGAVAVTPKPGSGDSSMQVDVVGTSPVGAAAASTSAN